MTQSDLIEKSFLPRTTVNRICRNKNDKGDGYKPTPRTVAALCVALGLTKAEKNDLFEIAFPEMYLLDEILDRKINLFDANIFLFEHNVEPLGRLEYDKKDRLFNLLLFFAIYDRIVLVFKIYFDLEFDL